MEAQHIVNQINEWLNEPQDFREGLRLLQRITRKHHLITRLLKHGKRDPLHPMYKRAHDRMIHELSLFSKYPERIKERI